MKNQSFIKYIFDKINSKCTIVSKFLLLVFTLSLFIPIPTGTTIDANIMTKLLATYLGLVSAYGLYAILLLFACYIDFMHYQKFIKTTSLIFIGTIDNI